MWMACIAATFALSVRLVVAQPPDGLFHNVDCEGAYAGHLQGICTDNAEFIFWSFTDVLVKTDRDGKVVAKAPVANHHGDLCYRDGNIYVAVNLGSFNDPRGLADSWVYVYRAADLSETARHKVPEAVYGAGGIAYGDGCFLVVGGLPPNATVNYAYQYDDAFRFVKRHAIASGYTRKGIQTAAHSKGFWWFGCYGTPCVLLKTDESFRLIGKFTVSASLGIVELPGGGFLVARGASLPDGKHTGSAFLADADVRDGLIARQP